MVSSTQAGAEKPQAVAALNSAHPLASVQSAKKKRASLNIPSIDGLRAISFFIVFLAHAGVAGIPGGFGVTVFFFLSGFLITTLMRIEIEDHGRVSLKLFYLRRVLRILPPFYIVLVIATTLAWFGVIGGKLSTPAVLSQVLHYSNFRIAAHGWGGIASGTGVYWSLAVEEHYYLLFPILFIGLYRLGIRGRRMAFAFWTICAAILVWRCILVFGLHAPVDRTYVTTDTRADSILFGSALAVWQNPSLDDSKALQSPLWRGLLLPLGLIVLLFTFTLRTDSFRESFRYSLQGIALYPLFITAIRYPEWAPYRLLNTRLFRHIGVLSYSLYLGHHAIIDAFRNHLRVSGVIVAALALLCAVLLSQVLYILVEKPCARLRRRLSAVG